MFNARNIVFFTRKLYLISKLCVFDDILLLRCAVQALNSFHAKKVDSRIAYFFEFSEQKYLNISVVLSVSISIKLILTYSGVFLYFWLFSYVWLSVFQTYFHTKVPSNPFLFFFILVFSSARCISTFRWQVPYLFYLAY